MAEVSFWKKCRLAGLGLIRGVKAQSVTEYVLVTAILALAFAAILATWNGPLAKFLIGVAQTIVKTR